LLGCAVVLLGIPVYAIIQKRRATPVVPPDSLLDTAMDRR